MSTRRTGTVRNAWKCAQDKIKESAGTGAYQSDSDDDDLTSEAPKVHMPTHLRSEASQPTHNTGSTATATKSTTNTAMTRKLAKDSEVLNDEDELTVSSFEHHTIGKNAQPKIAGSSPTLFTRANEPHSLKPSASTSPIPNVPSPRPGTPQPAPKGLAHHEVVSSSSSNSGTKFNPNSNEGTPQKDGPGLLLEESDKFQDAADAIPADDKSYDERDRTPEVDDNLSTSWLTRFKSRLSFNFGTTVAPNQVMTFSGQPEAAQDDDETTTHTLTQTRVLLEKDLHRLRTTHATGSSTLARLYHDCFHVDATLPQQIAERNATEELLRHTKDLQVAEAQCQLSKAIWERYRAAAAANEQIPDINDDEQPLGAIMASSSSKAPGLLQEAYKRFREDEDQRSEAQAKLQAAEAKRELAHATCSAFLQETKESVKQAYGRMDRAAKRLKTAEGWR